MRVLLYPGKSKGFAGLRQVHDARTPARRHPRRGPVEDHLLATPLPPLNGVRLACTLCHLVCHLTCSAVAVHGGHKVLGCAQQADVQPKYSWSQSSLY